MLWVTAFDFCEMLMNHCTYIIDIYYNVLQNVYSLCILWEDI